MDTYDAISNMYKAKELLLQIKDTGGDMAAALGYCTKSSRLFSGIKADNDSVQENLKQRLEESEEIKEELTNINNTVYMTVPISEAEIPQIELKNFALVRSLEDQLNKKFSGTWVSSLNIEPSGNVRIQK